MKKITLDVEGMHCSSCEMLVRESLEEIGVKDVKASHKTGKVTASVDEKLDMGKVKKAIEDNGYKLKAIK